MLSAHNEPIHSVMRRGFPSKVKKSSPVSESESSSLGFYFFGIERENITAQFYKDDLDIVGILCVWRRCVINPNSRVLLFEKSMFVYKTDLDLL